MLQNSPRLHWFWNFIFCRYASGLLQQEQGWKQAELSKLSYIWLVSKMSSQRYLGTSTLFMWLREPDCFIDHSYSKQVIGSRNPHNTVKALFKALNAVSHAFLLHFHHCFFFIFTQIDLIFFFFFFSYLKKKKQIETPKDVQEKFGRTVVESYLLWPVSYNLVRLAFLGSYSFRELGQERVCSALDQINFGI